MSDDTPTQPFENPPVGPGEVAVPHEVTGSSDPVEQDGKKSRGLMIALIVVGALLLIGLIILLIVLLSGNGKPVASPTTTASPSVTPSQTATASATPTRTPTPTPTHTTAPPPPSTSPSISSYAISPSQIDCSGTTPNLSITWTSVNGKNAYFGVNTDDAMTGGMGWVLPPSGSDADFPDGYRPYQALCGNDSTEYTITILGNDGTKVSKKVTVTKK